MSQQKYSLSELHEATDKAYWEGYRDVLKSLSIFKPLHTFYIWWYSASKNYYQVPWKSKFDVDGKWNSSFVDNFFRIRRKLLK